MNNGTSPLPPSSDDVVDVTEAAFTVAVPTPLSSTRSVEPVLENCRPAEPSAALSWLVTEAMPAEKSMPIT